MNIKEWDKEELREELIDILLCMNNVDFGVEDAAIEILELLEGEDEHT